MVGTQHFEQGNENLEIDITNIVNSYLTGETNYGLGIAFTRSYEETKTDQYQYVGFFTRHTQTYYEPFLETNYNDAIEDDRNSFSLGKINKLYLYIFEDGDFQNLDNNPLVTIGDQSGTPIPGLINLPSCQVTKGVYEVTIPSLLGYKTPCIFTDTWSNIL